MSNNDVTVLNLSTGREYYYVGLNPIDALISCAIYCDHKTSSLLDTKTRLSYQQKIIYSNKTASIGDLSVIC